MVVIKLWGGLGNQMFEYALYLSYKQKGINVKLDKSFYGKESDHGGYKLEEVFDVHAEYCNTAEKFFVKLPGKLLYKLLDRPYKEMEAFNGRFDPRVAQFKFGYLKGYWQTEKYFKDVEKDLRKQFVFPPLTDELNKQVLQQINTSNAVSIHIRRGDYLLNNRNWAMDNIYYKNALRFIHQKTTDPHFFVFSDDMEWARENIKEPNTVFVDWNKGKNSFMDMQLMSYCKHNIIANSSFSWWGAWLNSNENKIVITPDNWVGMEGTRDVLPEDWIQIAIKH